MAVRNYTQTNTSQACALNNYCSTSGGTIEAGRQASNGGAAGSTEVTFTVTAGATDDNEFSFEIILDGDEDGQAGDIDVNINFSTGNMTAILASVFVCRVSSGCVNQETIGSSTGLSVATNSGAQTVTVSGGAVTFSGGDKVIVTLGFTETGGHSNATVGITPSLMIGTPWAPASAGAGKMLLMGVG